jgi:hypothetical protein
VSRMQQVIDALEAERADLLERFAWLDGQIMEFRERHGDERATRPSAPCAELRHAAPAPVAPRRVSARLT